LQMKVWLEILQASPIDAPRCTSTKDPIRVWLPMRQPYRLLNDQTVTSSPNSTSAMTRKGASFAGLSGICRGALGADAGKRWDRRGDHAYKLCAPWLEVVGRGGPRRAWKRPSGGRAGTCRSER